MIPMHLPEVVAPMLQLQGHDAMLNGRLYRDLGAREGFTFCPYDIGTIEHDNFILGCAVAAYRR